MDLGFRPLNSLSDVVDGKVSILGLMDLGFRHSLKQQFKDSFFEFQSLV